MPEFHTVAVFTLPSEVVVAKLLLETEGIPCQTKDELTVQSFNLISNAVGGVKLQVEQENIARARVLLVDHGYVKEEKVEPSLVERTLNDPTKLNRIKTAGKVFFGLIILFLVVFTIFLLLEM